MDHIVIDGSNPWRGRYEFDLAESVETLTVREWGWIKRLSGYLPTTIGEGLEGADAELIATFAVLALHRNGKIDKREVPDVFERLVDSPYTAVRIEFGDVTETAEDDAGPPASANANGASSGVGSPTSSETSPQNLPASGNQSSDTSTSPRVTSAT